MLRFRHMRLFSLTIVFFYEYARGRSVLNGRVTFSGLACLVPPFPVSRATGLCTRTFPFRFTCSLTCTNMDCRLVSGYLSVSRFSLSLVDSSMLNCYHLCLPFIVCRLISRLVIFGL